MSVQDPATGAAGRGGQISGGPMARMPFAQRADEAIRRSSGVFVQKSVS